MDWPSFSSSIDVDTRKPFFCFICMHILCELYLVSTQPGVQSVQAVFLVSISPLVAGLLLCPCLIQMLLFCPATLSRRIFLVNTNMLKISP